MSEGAFYHIYNRGNNKEKIFFNRDNYLYFLTKARKHLLPHFDILAYCLMPNHFHFLVYQESLDFNKNYSKDLNIMLRSYTRGVNIQQDRIGSLFQKHTKFKLLNPTEDNISNNLSRNDIEYPFICFHYIHQNPQRAGLVVSPEEWEFSSYQDYAGIRNGTLVNKLLAFSLLNIPKSPELFIQQSNDVRIY